MKLEDLPNELLYELFKFLNTIHLFRAFAGLNSRFENLLFNHDQKYHLDFRSISKYDLEMVCHNHLPIFINQIISLHLSDDDETPLLSKIFFSLHFTLDQFKHLQSLSLYHIHSFDSIDQTISQCHYLLHFTHLSLIKCQFWHDEKTFTYIINNIWSLPSLTYCQLDYNLSGKQLLTKISILSLSIKRLLIKDIHCDYDTLSHLFKYTPNLRRLSTTSFCNSTNEQLQINIPSIISLNIIQKSSIYTMINLFHNMVNLCYLTVETWQDYLNGYEWEKIFVEHLPKIKLFRLRMYFKLSQENNKEEQVDELLDTFRTPFWLKKHQWFVQCNWTSLKSFEHAVLYTLPYTFKNFLYDNLCQSKSTFANKRDYRLYDHVNRLQYLEYDRNSMNSISIQFSNIQHFEIRLPCNDKIWSVMPTLNQLISLDVTLNYPFAYYQLQLLLNRAPRLYSLTFRCLTKIQMVLFHTTSLSIRRLDFISMSTLEVGHFNSFECDVLARSSIGQQCHILLIKVQNRILILDLIKAMLNLRVLIVQCEDEERRDKNSTDDKLLQWLHDHLPSTYLISRDRDESSKIHLWIG